MKYRLFVLFVFSIVLLIAAGCRGRGEITGPPTQPTERFGGMVFGAYDKNGTFHTFDVDSLFPASRRLIGSLTRPPFGAIEPLHLGDTVYTNEWYSTAITDTSQRFGFVDNFGIGLRINDSIRVTRINNWRCDSTGSYLCWMVQADGTNYTVRNWDYNGGPTPSLFYVTAYKLPGRDTTDFFRLSAGFYMQKHFGVKFPITGGNAGYVSAADADGNITINNVVVELYSAINNQRLDTLLCTHAQIPPGGIQSMAKYFVTNDGHLQSPGDSNRTIPIIIGS